jgi:hypothetical protein
MIELTEDEKLIIYAVLKRANSPDDMENLAIARLRLKWLNWIREEGAENKCEPTE